MDSRPSESTPAFCSLASHIMIRRRSTPSLLRSSQFPVGTAAGHCKIKVSNNPPRSGPDYPRALGAAGKPGTPPPASECIEARAGTRKLLAWEHCTCDLSCQLRRGTSRQASHFGRERQPEVSASNKKTLPFLATSSLHIENIYIRSNTRTEPEAHKKCPHDPISVSCKVK